jgi:hypothetical protein
MLKPLPETYSRVASYVAAIGLGVVIVMPYLCFVQTAKTPHRTPVPRHPTRLQAIQR